MQKIAFLFLIIAALLSQSCSVSFINSGIDYTLLKSFSIEQFGSKASNAPPTSGQTFSEQLKDRVLSNTRLEYVEGKGDIHFTGDVVDYRITSLAPQPNQTSALQRLTIQVQIDYKDNVKKDGSNDWTQAFSRFADFSAEQDLTSVETQLIQEIFDQMLDDVFNKAFSGW